MLAAMLGRHQGDREADGLPDRQACGAATCASRTGAVIGDPPGGNWTSPESDPGPILCPEVSRSAVRVRPRRARIRRERSVDLADRDRRLTRAESLRAATSPTSGRRRGRDQLRRQLRHLAGEVRAAGPAARRWRRWGVGFSTAFDYFRFDDWVAAPPSGEGPVGDQRIVPDLDRLVVLAAQPGWAWAPGRAVRADRRALPARLAAAAQPADRRARRRGASACCRRSRSSGWSRTDGDEFVPAGDRPGVRPGPAGRRSPTTAATCSPRSPSRASSSSSSTRSTPPGSSSCRSRPSRRCTRPTPRCWCARRSARSASSTACARRSRRRSTPPGVGNGGHVHLSLGRDERNLMAGGTGRFGLTDEAAAFAGGILEHLPALLAIGAPAVASYLRLVPQHWAGAYAAGAWRTARPRCGWSPARRAARTGRRTSR